jgi:hypothetical protein
MNELTPREEMLVRDFAATLRRACKAEIKPLRDAIGVLEVFRDEMIKLCDETKAVVARLRV